MIGVDVIGKQKQYNCRQRDDDGRDMAMSLRSAMPMLMRYLGLTAMDVTSSLPVETWFISAGRSRFDLRCRVQA